MRRQASGLSGGVVFFICLLVALVAFVAGARADQYGVFDTLYDNTTLGTAAETLPDDLDYSSVEQVYDTLRRSYDGDLTQQQLLDGLKSGLAEASGDPYTEYLTAEQAEQFRNDLNGTFSGIGAEIGMENDILIIVSPLDGFPAQKAGLRPKDAIIQIDERETFGMSIEEAVSLIRGQAGTDVTLTLLRDGERIERKITRDAIVVPSVTSEKIEGTNIGYLRISRFADDTTQLAQQAANEFVRQGVDGVVLDLRNNSGGFLSAAVEVSSLWVENEPIVEQRENGGKVVAETLRAGRNAPLQDMPTTVLINEGSASASEIVAGALQDYELARLVGQTSFGKGSVQSLEELPDGGQLKVTIARWYTPNGRNIDEEGIEPEVAVEMSEEDYENDADPQKDRAVELLTQ